MNPVTVKDLSWNHEEEEYYGIGKVRDVAQFYQTFGIHAQEKVVEAHLCNFVTSGEMHRLFHDDHLHTDNMGVDYSQVRFRFHELHLQG
mmetsp:Transcript_27732/g.40976  ORF Transcript_27732/g.40976 Transcript_27732/m.40976 type:complete len:89 (+) Transcript_27732:1802-2068(+)